MARGGTDLNLLPALQAILEEANVTRAGARLGMSQPAMSAVLAKLRRSFDDELLVRTGRDFAITPVARELLPEVQEAVRLMREALVVSTGFDAAVSERVFRLTMSDYAMSVLLEPLLSRVADRAPGVRLTVDHIQPAPHAAARVLLDYDAMVAPLGLGFTGCSRRLWRDRMVCLLAADNPRVGEGPLTLADLARMPHAEASFGPGTVTPCNRVLGELDVRRRVQVTVDGWLPVPFVIEGTRLIAIVPERLARQHVRPGGPLVVMEPPFGEVLLVEGYWYAATRLHDPGTRWLFGLLDEVGNAVEREPPPAGAPHS